MRDAVAEVLLERRALVPRRSPFLIFSVALHALVALVLLASGRRDTLERRTPVLNIRLAPAATPRTPPPVIAAPVPAVSKPVDPPAPIETKKELEPKSAKKEPPKKPVDKTLFGRSTEKPVPRINPPASSTQAAPVSPPASRAETVRGAGSAGVSGLEGGDFPYTIYIDRMLTLIGNHWLRPQARGEVMAQVYFVIERDGRVRDVRIETPSGSPVFDRAALRAVIEASPLPPLPFAYSGTYLGVHLTFH